MPSVLSYQVRTTTLQQDLLQNCQLAASTSYRPICLRFRLCDFAGRMVGVLNGTARFRLAGVGCSGGDCGIQRFCTTRRRRTLSIGLVSKLSGDRRTDEQLLLLTYHQPFISETTGTVGNSPIFVQKRWLKCTRLRHRHRRLQQLHPHWLMAEVICLYRTHVMVKLLCRILLYPDA